MSVLRPTRCIFSASAVPIRPRSQCRTFHASPSLPERRRPRFRSVKASEMGLVEQEAASRPVTDFLKPYTEEEKEELAKKYTPEQLEAIEAGEEAIDLEDIRGHGFIRTDPYRLDYIDDLSVIRPVIDNRPQSRSTIPEDAVFQNDEQAFEEVSQWMNDVYQESEQNKPLGPALGGESKAESQRQHGPDGVDFLKHIENSTGMTGGGKPGSYAIAPGLPKMPELVVETDADGEAVPDPGPERFQFLQKKTGLSMDMMNKLKMKVVVSHRVVNQTRLGKIQSMYAMAICGNGQGRLGVGEAKATESEDAHAKAIINAVRNMVPITRYEDRTIYGEVEGKVSGTVVRLMSRPPGFGLRCQHNIFEMARAAGISDLAARTPRSRNKMNVCKAVWQALLKQRIPDDIARGRGKKLVDVRKVYYGGDQRLSRIDKTWSGRKEYRTKA